MDSHTDWPSDAGLHDLLVRCGETRTVPATLALPPGLPGGAPIVLCLHYGGMPVGHYGRALLEHLVAPAWQALGAVMLAPVSAHGDWTHAEDSALALDALAQAAARYGCGPRIITGYSLGAIGTWHLIAQSPAEFVAAVPIAGPPPGVAVGDTPVRALNSSADRLFPAAATVEAVRALSAAGRDAACVLVEGVDHYAFAGFAHALSALLPWLASRCAGCLVTR